MLHENYNNLRTLQKQKSHAQLAYDRATYIYQYQKYINRIANVINKQIE